jgi:Zn-dependent peptidase ImmA (M78 family)
MTGDIHSERAWRNASVLRLSPEADPLNTVSNLVNDLLLRAADEGAVGAPTDPFQLASLMGIGLRPHFDVADARLVAEPGEPSVADAPLARFVRSGARLFIEYNPTRPRGRLRYSVAHELAHAFFPDAGDEIRHRTYTGAVEELAADDSWELELVCNVAAAEILMPTAAIEGLLNSDTDIDYLMAKRAQFHVSTEALLRRLVHATSRPMALAAFNRIRESATAPLRCDYVLTSRAWSGELGRGTVIEPAAFPVAPSAVGQTTRGTATIDGETWKVQAVGTPPYPGRLLPRVLALVEPADAPTSTPPGLTYKAGDISAATDAAVEGRPVVVAHVVNDSARAWGRYGVAGALARVVPDAAKAFKAWTIANPDNLTLGNIHPVSVRAVNGAEVTVVSLVAQAGYGPSTQPRVSYVKLAEALHALADVAAPVGATVHMPRIGAGQGGGRWDLIEAAVERTLLARGVPVVVYTLPAGPAGTRAEA